MDLNKRRSDPTVTYPIAEYGQLDPLLQAQSAVTGVHVYRNNAIPQLTNLLLFGDFPSGEIFYLQADKLPSGGQDGIRRILLNDGGEAKTFLKVIQEKNAKQGKTPTTRADLRFGAGPDGPGAAAQQARRHDPPARARRALDVNVKEVVHLRQPLGNASTASAGRGSRVDAGGYRSGDTDRARRFDVPSCDRAPDTPTRAAAFG